MDEERGRIGKFVVELRRRKTLSTLVLYGAVALGIVEGTDFILGIFESPPNWILPFLIITFIVTLPFVAIGSWIFDVTPPGLERTDAQPAASTTLFANAELSVESVAEQEGADSLPARLKPSVSLEMGSAQLRQVTVLSCTFAPVSDEDPEMMLAILPEIEQIVERVASLYTGRRITGSSTSIELVFGFPAAHENDAGRAVAAGFALVEGARAVAFAGKGRLSAAVGVHSDLAVLQATPSGLINVVGRTAQVAAWLQSLAPPDAVTLDDTTLRLLQGRFQCEPLGEFTHPMVGISTTLYQARMLVEPSDCDDDIEFVGRDSEISLIMERWHRAADGEDQFVVLRGEPGIGKSRLAREVIQRIQKVDSPRTIRMYCSPFDSSSPFHPIVHFFTARENSAESKGAAANGISRMERFLEESGLPTSGAGPLMSTLLSFDDPESKGQSREAARHAMVEGLLEFLNAAAKRSAVLLLVEDLHWADPSTLEILATLVSQNSNSGMLCLFTTRPSQVLDWEGRSNVTTVAVGRMSRRTAETFVENILGETKLSREHVQRIISETDGNPLFVEEFTKAVVESVDRNPEKLSSGLVVPGTLHQSLASRMDNLGSAKALLQLCSLLGREFSYELLKAVSQTENETALQDELKTIVNAEFLTQNGSVPDSKYVFKHMLMQETANHSLLRTTRTALHAHVATILQEQFPDTVDRNAELLAFHFEESDQSDKAALFWASACQRALGSYALLEGIGLARNGLRAIERVPQSIERDRAEIALTSLLGKGLLTTRGYADPEVEQTFTRALALCETIGDEPHLFQMVGGLWMYFEIGGDAEHALFLAERLVKMSQAGDSPARTLQAHYCCGYTLYRLGRYAESRDQLERAMREEGAEADFTSESASGDDTRIHIRCALAHVLWHLGNPQQAVSLADEARSLAIELENPYGILWATFQTAWLFQLMDQPELAFRFSSESLEMAEEKAFGFFQPIGAFVKAWADGDGGRSLHGAAAEGRIQRMNSATQRHRKAGARLGVTQMILSIVEGMIGLGQLDEAEIRLDEVRREVDAVGERFFEPEIPRMKGLIAWARGDAVGAKSHFTEALERSRHTGSVSLALRATKSLAELSTANGDSGRAEKRIENPIQAAPEQPR